MGRKGRKRARESLSLFLGPFSSLLRLVRLAPERRRGDRKLLGARQEKEEEGGARKERGKCTQRGGEETSLAFPGHFERENFALPSSYAVFDCRREEGRGRNASRRRLSTFHSFLRLSTIPPFPSLHRLKSNA